MLCIYIMCTIYMYQLFSAFMWVYCVLEKYVHTNTYLALPLEFSKNRTTENVFCSHTHLIDERRSIGHRRWQTHTRGTILWSLPRTVSHPPARYGSAETSPTKSFPTWNCSSIVLLLYLYCQLLLLQALSGQGIWRATWTGTQTTKRGLNLLKTNERSRSWKLLRIALQMDASGVTKPRSTFVLLTSNPE